MWRALGENRQKMIFHAGEAVEIFCKLYKNAANIDYKKHIALIQEIMP